MTSITHPSSTVLPGRRAHAAPLGTRLRFGADSKAVRVGLGVAIAAVMAGDVYAVLRSPVSEGSSGSAGRGAASAPPADAAGAAGSGFVATNPYSEAAYRAELAGRSVAPPVGVGAAGADPAAATAPAAGAPAAAVVAPTLAPAPAAPGVSSFVPSFAPPAGPSDTGDTPPAPPAAESPLAPIVELVPPAAPVVTIVEEVLAEAPVAVPVPSVESLPVTLPPALTSGLSL